METMFVCALNLICYLCNLLYIKLIKNKAYVSNNTDIKTNWSFTVRFYWANFSHGKFSIFGFMLLSCPVGVIVSCLRFLMNSKKYIDIYSYYYTGGFFDAPWTVHYLWCLCCRVLILLERAYLHNRIERNWCIFSRPECALCNVTAWRHSKLRTHWLINVPTWLGLGGGGGAEGKVVCILRSPVNCSVFYLSFVYKRTVWPELNGGENSLR